MSAPASPAGRAGTALGWIAGGTAGLLASWALSPLVPAWATIPLTFVLLVLGFFGGMALSTRLGARALRVMGIAAGVLFAIVLTLVALTLTAGGDPH
jgi:hypothetical protein